MYSLRNKIKIFPFLLINVIGIILIVACSESSPEDVVINSEPASSSSQAETDTIQDLRILQEAEANLGAVASYQASQEYWFLIDPDNPDSDRHSTASINPSCVIDVAKKASYCQVQVELFQNNTTTRINSEMIKQNDEYWFQREGEDWQIISEFDARFPGLVKGIIDPSEFIDSITSASLAENVILAQGTAIKVVFVGDAKAFMGKALGQDGLGLYNQGENFEFEGSMIIGQEDELIYEYSSTITFMLDGVPVKIHLTQTLSDFDESVDIPDLNK